MHNAFDFAHHEDTLISDSQQSPDILKAKVAQLNRRLPCMGSPITTEVREWFNPPTFNDHEMDNVSGLAPLTSHKHGNITFAVFSVDGSLNSSPNITPSWPFQAPNHLKNDVDAL